MIRRPDLAVPYWPGQTARPDPVLFDALCDTASVGDPLASDAWRAGTLWYDEGFFWEAHEMWEAVWMAALPNSAARLLAQAAIQMANLRLKAAMGQPRAAVRIHDRAARLVTELGYLGDAALPATPQSWFQNRWAALKALDFAL